MPETLEPKKNINFLEANNAPNPETALPAPEKPRKKKNFFLYFCIIVAVLIIGLAIHRFAANGLAKSPLINGQILEPKKIGILQAVKNFFFNPSETLTGEKNDRVNILLLGVGGPGHDGPYLSDTNIIASLKPSTGEIALISVPRDLGVKIENYGVYKINYADAFGESKFPGQGGDYARQIFSQTFNLDVPYYVRVDFKAFEEIINAVGNIVVDVPRAFVDQSFPGPDYSYQTVSFEAGSQIMDGARALQYARSRHGNNGEGSDFARAHRQQQVMLALKDKVLSFGTLANPMKIQKILESLSNNIGTNLNLSQIIYLAKFAENIEPGKIKGLVLDDGPSGPLNAYIAPNGAFLLEPKTGNFDQINQAVANIFDPNFKLAIATSSQSTAFVSGDKNTSQNYKQLEMLKLEIQNGTWRAGLASRMQNILSDRGFAVLTIGNSLKRPIATTTIYLINQKADNNALAELLKLTPGRVETNLPDWLKTDYDDPSTAKSEAGLKYNPDVDALIILGANVEE